MTPSQDLNLQLETSLVDKGQEAPQHLPDLDSKEMVPMFVWALVPLSTRSTKKIDVII